MFFSGIMMEGAEVVHKHHKHHHIHIGNCSSWFSRWLGPPPLCFVSMALSFLAAVLGGILDPTWVARAHLSWSPLWEPVAPPAPRDPKMRWETQQALGPESAVWFYVMFFGLERQVLISCIFNHFVWNGSFAVGLLGNPRVLSLLEWVKKK